ncbi:RT22 protein, partial [Polypterus senegalus]
MAALGVTRCFFRRSHQLKKVETKYIVGLGWVLRRHGSVDSQSSNQPSLESQKLMFSDEKVQSILTRITGLDLQKVFRPVKMEMKPPSYHLMTDEQLSEATKTAEEAARQRLQMPPVLPERKPICDILAVDKVLDGLEKSKYVFTDITFNVPHRERFIVIRESDGTLRKATWEERDRMVQIYFPFKGRRLTTPAVFKEANMKVVFLEDRHELLLDHCLVQFEPDSAEYKQIHHLTYENIDQHGKYDLLRSTRHFGGMVWYLVSERRIDGLIIDMIQRDLIHDAESVVELYHMMYPQCQSAKEASEQQASGIELLKVYARTESKQSGYIELALQVYPQISLQTSG